MCKQRSATCPASMLPGVLTHASPSPSTACATSSRWEDVWRCYQSLRVLGIAVDTTTLNVLWRAALQVRVSHAHWGAAAAAGSCRLFISHMGLITSRSSSCCSAILSEVRLPDSWT